MKAIVLQINGLNCNWLGAYGNEWVETYHFDRLAAESVVFDQHIADLPHPSFVWRSLFSGRYGFSGDPTPGEQLPALLQGVRTILIHDRENPGYPTDDWEIVFSSRPEEDETPIQGFIATLEGALDYLDEVPEGLLWIETDLLLPPWSVDLERFRKFATTSDETEEEADSIEEDSEEEDFDEIETGELVPEEDDSEETESEQPEPEEENEAIEEEPEASEPEPTHTELDPPVGPFDASNLEEWDFLHGSFAAVVNEFDDLLETIQEMLVERNLDQDAIWMITSNCGQPLGEHGFVGLHRPWLHEELIHLPLIVRFPKAAHAGKRISALTQPVDLVPTLLRQFSRPLADSIQGKDLLPLVENIVPQVREYAVVQLQLGDAREEAIRTEDRYLILPRCGEIDDAPRPKMLFAKPEDKWEVNNLQQHHLDWVDSAEKLIEPFLQACAKRDQFDPPKGPE